MKLTFIGVLPVPGSTRCPYHLQCILLAQPFLALIPRASVNWVQCCMKTWSKSNILKRVLQTRGRIWKMCPHQRNRNPLCRKSSQRSPALYRGNWRRKSGLQTLCGSPGEYLPLQCPHFNIYNVERFLLGASVLRG